MPLETFAARAEALYTLPAVAMEVLHLTNCPKVDVAALTACIERDPALVGKVLRTVNSSLFGVATKVSDLRQAVALLGIKPLKLLVLGFSLPPELLSGLQQQSLQTYWRSTLIKAVAARELAAACAEVDPDEAFLAGLLQDIGMLVLLKELGEPYALFLAKTRQEHGDLLLLELETLGFDHRLLSARLLATWGLPASLWRAVADACDGADAACDGASVSGLSHILAASDAVSDLLVGGDANSLADLPQHVVDHQHWAYLAARLQKRVDQLASVFDVAMPEGKDYQQIILQAHTQLATAAEEAAAQLAAAAPAANLWDETRALKAAASAFEHNAQGEFSVLGESAPELARETPDTCPAAVSAVDLDSVARAVSVCRRRRQALSLLLVEIDDFAEVAIACGIDGVQKQLRRLTDVIATLSEQRAAVQATADAQIAALLGGADRAAAVEVARHLLDTARRGEIGPAGDKVSLSIGIATVALPARNFPAHALVEAAQRCLFGVRAGGGDGVKSIDIY